MDLLRPQQTDGQTGLQGAWLRATRPAIPAGGDKARGGSPQGPATNKQQLSPPAAQLLQPSHPSDKLIHPWSWGQEQEAAHPGWACGAAQGDASSSAGITPC